MSLITTCPRCGYPGPDPRAIAAERRMKTILMAGKIAHKPLALTVCGLEFLKGVRGDKR